MHIYICKCIYTFINICFVQKIKYVLFYTKCTEDLGDHGDEGEKMESVCTYGGSKLEEQK